MDKRYATTIVAVSGGYPEAYEKGFVINGLATVNNDDQTMLFHSGTKEEDGNIVTNGGRVICATALSEHLDEAVELSREAIDSINFEGKYYRRDIGFEFIKDLS
jgi:phosphoribosylamine--glycine ligase